MLKASIAVFASACAALSSFALAADTASSLAVEVRNEADAGLDALSAGDYGAATLHFEAARERANRLSLQDVARRVSAASPDLHAEDTRFTLAASSTLQFDEFLKDRKATETRFLDPEGKVVVVRVFAEEGDMADFKFIAERPEIMKKASLEMAEMPGGTVLKRKTAGGGLSLLMMSAKDHALIEVEGPTTDGVMAVVDKLETTPAAAAN